LLTFAQSAVRIVIETVMREELDLFKRYRRHIRTRICLLPSTPHRIHLSPINVLSLWREEAKGVARDSSQHMAITLFGN
jgi:hypothetical protein